MSLRRYIFICLSLIGVVTAAVLTILESQRLRQLLVEGGDEEQRFAVSAMTAQVEQQLDGHVKAQEALARRFEALVADRARAPLTRGSDGSSAVGTADLPTWELERALAEAHGMTSAYSVYVGDATGHSVVYDPPVNSDGTRLTPTDYHDRDYYQGVVATGETFVSQVQRGRRTPVTTFYIGTPIWGQQHRLAGYLGCSVSLDAFQKIADSVAARLAGATVILLDRRGLVIASSGTTSFAQMQDLGSLPVFGSAGVSPSSREGIDPHNVPVRVATALTHRDGLEWTAAVYRPTALLDETIDRTRIRAALGASVVLIAALAIASVVARAVATPVTRLARVATTIGDGDFDVEAPQFSRWAPTELGGLAAAIGEMMLRLRAYTVEREAKVNELLSTNARLSESLTALREAQEKFLQAGRLAAVGQLAGGIAHDFNNVLQVILTSVSFLEEEPSDGDEFKGDIDEMRKAARRGANLVRQLLAFSRRQTLRPKLVDLNLVLLDMKGMLERTIREDVQLKVKPCVDALGVFIDPVQIEQVLLNLVVNARDALPKGGTITIELRKIAPAKRKGSRSTRWSPGSEVAFSPYPTTERECRRRSGHGSSSRSSHQRADKGTGLGLATVYGIVKQSGGEITVTSELGRGTTFAVKLPISEVEEVRRSSERAPARNGSRAR